MERERGAREACEFVRKLDFDRSQVAFDAAFERRDKYPSASAPLPSDGRGAGGEGGLPANSRLRTVGPQDGEFPGKQGLTPHPVYWMDFQRSPRRSNVPATTILTGDCGAFQVKKWATTARPRRGRLAHSVLAGGTPALPCCRTLRRALPGGCGGDTM